MLQNKIANDEIIRLILARPPLRQVCHRESHMLVFYLFSGFLDHSLRKIQRVDACSDLSEEDCVLPRAAADLQDRLKTLIRKLFSQDLPVEIAR